MGAGLSCGLYRIKGFKTQVLNPRGLKTLILRIPAREIHTGREHQLYKAAMPRANLYCRSCEEGGMGSWPQTWRMAGAGFGWIKDHLGRPFLIYLRPNFIASIPQTNTFALWLPFLFQPFSYIRWKATEDPVQCQISFFFFFFFGCAGSELWHLGSWLMAAGS